MSKTRSSGARTASRRGNTPAPWGQTDRPQERPAGVTRVRVAPLVVLALALGGALFWSSGRGPRRPTILPSHVVSAGSPGWTPETVSALLLHQKELGLRPDQERRLKTIASAEQRSVAPVLKRLAADETEMDRFAETASQHGGVTPAALQEESAPLTADSRDLARQRRAYWSQASLILTPAQRIQAERLGRLRFVTAPGKRGGS